MAEEVVKEGEVVENKSSEDTKSTTETKENNSKDVMAIISLVLGILSLCAWFIPCCGFIVTIPGIILGILGIKSKNKTMAIIGIALASLGLIASGLNMILGLATSYGDFNNYDMPTSFE
jgi:hypothetical protein